MKWLCLALFLVSAIPATADLRGGKGQFTVTAYAILSQTEGMIYINPMTRAKYFLVVQNPESTVKMLTTNKYSGQVTVTFELINPQYNSSAAIVRKIKAVNVEHLPEYDGPFKEVKRNQKVN